MIIAAIIEQLCKDNNWRLERKTWSIHLDEHYHIQNDSGKICLCEIAIRKGTTILAVADSRDAYVHHISLADPNSIQQTQQTVLKICKERREISNRLHRPLRRHFSSW
jgi:uncharacterized short protein YbdD (DUF466 family)